MVWKGRHTLGIFSHKLTDSTDVFGSKPIAGSRGQPFKCIRNRSEQEVFILFTFHIDDKEK